MSFQFKQFIIQQDQSGMKVCTDACILGAWFANRIQSGSKILDIGSGTGLLMLMMAQKIAGEFIGIELDTPSFKQQQENVTESKWSDRIKVLQGDARDYPFPVKYDFIISNPPFFENDLSSSSSQKNLAKHSSQLKLEELLKIIIENLEGKGSFGLLLPFHRGDYFETLALKHGFVLKEKLLVKQTPHHDYFRSILHFSTNKENPSSIYELVIKDENGNYTTDFVELMKDYYLYL